jgi:hypothetical protein
MPADSFSGKSTLVTELVKQGAEYYSDDFAIIDREGSLHPFARQISMRTREASFSVYEIDPKELNAEVGTRPVPIGLVLITKYKPRARWAPKMIAGGEGVLRTIPFALGVNQHPNNVLAVLQKINTRVPVISTERGDAAITARRLLKFFDSNVI